MVMIWRPPHFIILQYIITLMFWIIGCQLKEISTYVFWKQLLGCLSSFKKGNFGLNLGRYSYFSLFKDPKKINDVLEGIGRQFFWNGKGNK